MFCDAPIAPNCTALSERFKSSFGAMPLFSANFLDWWRRLLGVGSSNMRSSVTLPHSFTFARLSLSRRTDDFSIDPKHAHTISYSVGSINMESTLPTEKLPGSVTRPTAPAPEAREITVPSPVTLSTSARCA